MRIGFVYRVLDGAVFHGMLLTTTRVDVFTLVVVVENGNSVLCSDCGISAFLNSCSQCLRLLAHSWDCVTPCSIVCA